ncbi:MAG: hypothetical protein LBK40_00465 [Spirochaetaceae bacterium]|jgi:hypothetical protein|nr:hypothetical protein [Spirochaetaceae bacterium]
MEFEWYSEKERINIEKHGIDLEMVKQVFDDPSSEQKERIKAARKRHAAVDPGCEKLTPEELIQWHPARGISWEERARAMRAAGITDPKQKEVSVLGAVSNK